MAEQGRARNASSQQNHLKEILIHSKSKWGTGADCVLTDTTSIGAGSMCYMKLITRFVPRQKHMTPYVKTVQGNAEMLLGADGVYKTQKNRQFL